MVSVEAFHTALRDTDVSVIEKLVEDHVRQGVSAQEILSQGLIKAMEIVGRAFKAKEIWVPEVLLTARNMDRGINILRPFLAAAEVRPRGTVLLGTVKGDVHDIGKNIVAIVMGGSGFKVIDLGVDVAAERFVEAIDQYKPDIVGLSALLTTTMLGMQHIVAAIREHKGDRTPRVIVGGAPVTGKFAHEIGADGYGEDAAAAVDIVLKLLEKEGHERGKAHG